jgi:hypothetical protein
LSLRLNFNTSSSVKQTQGSVIHVDAMLFWQITDTRLAGNQQVYFRLKTKNKTILTTNTGSVEGHERRRTRRRRR